MNSDKIVMEGLTYDDVLLIPARSEVLPREVDIQTRFTRFGCRSYRPPWIP